MDIRTLNGYTPDEVKEILARPVPPPYYKKVPYSNPPLTDISPAALKVVLTGLFGQATLGWSVEVIDKEFLGNVGQTKKGNPIFGADATVRLRVRWVIDGKLEWSEPIEMPGGAEGVSAQYVTKSAVTSALGKAASAMGWQRLVYEGKMDHASAAKWYQRVDPHPFEDDFKLLFLRPDRPGDNGHDSKPQEQEAEPEPEPEPEEVVRPAAPPKEEMELDQPSLDNTPPY